MLPAASRRGRRSAEVRGARGRGVFALRTSGGRLSALRMPAVWQKSSGSLQLPAHRRHHRLARELVGRSERHHPGPIHRRRVDAPLELLRGGCRIPTKTRLAAATLGKLRLQRSSGNLWRERMADAASGSGSPSLPPASAASTVREGGREVLAGVPWAQSRRPRRPSRVSCAGRRCRPHGLDAGYSDLPAAVESRPSWMHCTYM
jgi:hypothetical protein